MTRIARMVVVSNVLYACVCAMQLHTPSINTYLFKGRVAEAGLYDFETAHIVSFLKAHRVGSLMGTIYQLRHGCNCRRKFDPDGFKKVREIRD